MKKPFAMLCVFLAASVIWPLPNYPDAEGYGVETIGGRGGRILIVTNTNAAGAGSFAAAIQTPGPRIIVFQTSGVINLIMNDLAANTSFVTVAGQTSPGGITFTKTGGTLMSAYRTGFHDGVFRFLRFRGNDNTYDNISLNTCYNVMYDHCDFSGSSDEAFDITFSHDFTVSWCTIANSGAGQTYGALIAYTPTSNVSIHHTLFAHHVHRGGPHMHWGSQPASETAIVQYINNICYDNVNCRHLDCTAPVGSAHWNFVGNYFKAGPNTGSDCWNGYPPANIAGGSNVTIYDTDNIWKKSNGTQSTEVLDLRYSSPTRVTTPFNMPAVTTYSAQAAYDTVLNKVGALPRDAMNTRTVADVRNGTGVLRKTDDAKITSGPAFPTDSDRDGMPDFWETAMGFNPNDSAGKNEDHDGDGYTNIEEYINDVALARLCMNYYNPPYPIPSDWPDYNPNCCHSLAVEQEMPAASAAFSLSVSPNPFRTQTVISIKGKFQVASYKLAVFNIQGKQLKTCNLKLETQNKAIWTAAGLPAGIYIVRAEWAGRALEKRVAVVR